MNKASAIEIRPCQIRPLSRLIASTNTYFMFVFSYHIIHIYPVMLVKRMFKKFFSELQLVEGNLHF